jgi:hypothetical protein
VRRLPRADVPILTPTRPGRLPPAGRVHASNGHASTRTLISPLVNLSPAGAGGLDDLGEPPSLRRQGAASAVVRDRRPRAANPLHRLPTGTSPPGAVFAFEHDKEVADGGQGATPVVTVTQYSPNIGGHESAEADSSSSGFWGAAGVVALTIITGLISSFLVFKSWESS